MLEYPMTLITSKSEICEINFKSFPFIAFFKIKIPANFGDCLMARKSGDDNRFRSLRTFRNTNLRILL